MFPIWLLLGCSRGAVRQYSSGPRVVANNMILNPHREFVDRRLLPRHAAGAPQGRTEAALLKRRDGIVLGRRLIPATIILLHHLPEIRARDRGFRKAGADAQSRFAGCNGQAARHAAPQFAMQRTILLTDQSLMRSKTLPSSRAESAIVTDSRRSTATRRTCLG
jgi:hypothetical protein